MKTQDKKQLLASSLEELNKQLTQLQGQLIKARQERQVQDKTQVNIKQAYTLREQIKMIKSEMRRRQLETL